MGSRNKDIIRSANWLLHCSILTTDEEQGKLGDFFFDEEEWRLKYLVVRTGLWLHGREALLSVDVVRDILDEEETLALTVTSKGIQQSPDVDTKLPISRQAELLLAKHWMWATPEFGALSPQVSGNIAAEASQEGKEMSEKSTDSRLRSINEVKGYSISTPDGKLGHMDDLLFDSDWKICYAVADTRNWLPGKSVLLPVNCIEKIRWSDGSLHVWPSRELIREAPEYDPGRVFTKADADALEKHYACAKSSS